MAPLVTQQQPEAGEPESEVKQVEEEVGEKTGPAKGDGDIAGVGAAGAGAFDDREAGFLVDELPVGALTGLDQLEDHLLPVVFQLDCLESLRLPAPLRVVIVKTLLVDVIAGARLLV